jgi:hypothetical protein
MWFDPLHWTVPINTSVLILKGSRRNYIGSHHEEGRVGIILDVAMSGWSLT